MPIKRCDHCGNDYDVPDEEKPEQLLTEIPNEAGGVTVRHISGVLHECPYGVQVVPPGAQA